MRRGCSKGKNVGFFTWNSFFFFYFVEIYKKIKHLTKFFLKTDASGLIKLDMAKFRPNLGQLWIKWVIFKFSSKSETLIFPTPDKNSSKKLENSNEQIKKNAKTSFFGANIQIWVNFGQKGHFSIFQNTAKTSFFRIHWLGFIQKLSKF